MRDLLTQRKKLKTHTSIRRSRIPMNSNLPNSTRSTFPNIIKLHSNLPLTIRIRRLLPVKVESVVFESGFGGITGGCGVTEFSSFLGVVHEGFGVGGGSCGSTVWVEGAGTDVEVDPVSGFENFEVSQRPLMSQVSQV